MFQRRYLPSFCVNHPLLRVFLLFLYKKHTLYWIWNSCKQSLTILSSFFTVKSTLFLDFIFRLRNYKKKYEKIMEKSFYSDLSHCLPQKKTWKKCYQRRICWTQAIFFCMQLWRFIIHSAPKYDSGMYGHMCFLSHTIKWQDYYI